MKQFILSEKPGGDNIVRLKGKDFSYLVRVRRYAVGEFFPAVLPNGEETEIQIISIDKGVLTGKCAAQDEAALQLPLPEQDDVSPSLPRETSLSIPPIILFQAMPKGDKMDLIVRQAAEGGITEIVPFVSEFSITKKDPGRQKFSRWERIIKEARQQSGSLIATTIRRPLTKLELFEYWKKLKEECLSDSPQDSPGRSGAAGLLFHHQGLEQESLHSYLNIVPKIVTLAVGPEGGFSETEVSQFIESGFKPLTIGDTILRTETAALYCAAAVKILLLESSSWELKQPKKNCV